MGVLKKIILPSLGLGNSGLLHIESRPATAEEILEANKPIPKPKPIAPEEATTDECKEFSLTKALDERAELQAKIWALESYINSVGGVGGALAQGDVYGAAKAQEYITRLSFRNMELQAVEREIAACS